MKKYLTQLTNLDGHDGEGDPETADRVGDEDEADHHHEGRRDQHRLDGLKKKIVWSQKDTRQIGRPQFQINFILSPSHLWHYFQVLVNVDEVGVKHRHLKANALEKE